MPRKKSKKRKNQVFARTKPTSEQSEVELVTDLSLLNNNVSSYLVDDEILLESLKKEDTDRFRDQDSVSSDVKGVSVPVKKRVQLQTKGGVIKHLKYWGSKFERKHDTISLDKFFIKKTLRNKKIKKSRGSKYVFIKSEDDEDVDEISFKVTKEHLDRIFQDKTKDEVESKEITAEDSLEDLGDVMEDFFPNENFDREVFDLNDLSSETETDQEKDLETAFVSAFDLLEVLIHLQSWQPSLIISVLVDIPGRLGKPGGVPEVDVGSGGEQH